MNRRKKVELNFTGAKALVMQGGTEIVENLPKVFEVRGQGELNFRFSVQLMKTPVKGQYVADITLQYEEDIQCVG